MTLPEMLYLAGYRFKKRYVTRHSRALPYPVISVGNITVGGTGKTPAAVAVAQEARQRGYSPVILTRGYRGKAKGPCFVSDGSRVLLSPEQAGDEPVIIAERLGDVPVVKSADRYEGGTFAIANLPARGDKLLFILDDGFQHWGLRRDIDIVLVDGINPFGSRRLLPIGPMRGPMSELEAADIFVITKLRNDKAADLLRQINSDAPIFFSGYEITGVKDIRGNLYGVDMLADKKVFAFCGIANPESFRNSLKQTGCTVAALRPYRDHHSYSERDLKDLVSRARQHAADFIVTTEKDMVKLKGLKQLPEKIYYLEISFSTEPGFYDAVFGKLQGKKIL